MEIEREMLQGGPEVWRSLLRLEKFGVVLDCCLGHFPQQNPITSLKKDIEKNKTVLLRIPEIMPLNGNYIAFARL